MLATEESKAGYPQSKKQPLKFRAHIMPDEVMNRDNVQILLIFVFGDRFYPGQTFD